MPCMPHLRRRRSSRACLGPAGGGSPPRRPHWSCLADSGGSLQLTGVRLSWSAAVSTACPAFNSWCCRIRSSQKQFGQHNRQVGRCKGPYRPSPVAQGRRDAELIACHEHSVGPDADVDSCPESCPFTGEVLPVRGEALPAVLPARPVKTFESCPQPSDHCPSAASVAIRVRGQPTRSPPGQSARAPGLRRQPRRTPWAA